jgi:L-lactate dehydrogenase (cytochrome)
METVEKVEVKITDEEKARQRRISARPPLSEILNLHDFEVIFSLRIGFILKMTLVR